MACIAYQATTKEPTNSYTLCSTASSRLLKVSFMGEAASSLAELKALRRPLSGLIAELGRVCWSVAEDIVEHGPDSLQPMLLTIAEGFPLQAIQVKNADICSSLAFLPGGLT